MKKSHGPTFRKELKRLMECGICRGTTVTSGTFYQLDCMACNASGWVCAETGAALPVEVMVQQLSMRLRNAIAELARARHSIGGVHEQYEQNNRRGAGGSHLTGD